MPSEEHRLAPILNLVSYCHDFLRGARSEDSAAYGDGSVQPKQLAEALEVYEAHRARWWSWLFPAFRRQRRIVATALGREHLTRATDISPLRAWIEAHRLRMKLSALRVRRLSHLPIQEISAHFDIADERRLVGLCSTVKEVLQVRDVACQLSTKIVTALSREVSSDLLVDHGRLKQLYDQIVRIQKALEAQKEEQKAKALVQKRSLSKRRGPLELLADAVETGDPEKARGIASYLESHLPLVPQYRALLSLFTGPLAPWHRTAQAWLRKAEEKEFTDKEIEERKLISATADGCQGDERDVILYSLRFAPNSSPRMFTLAAGLEGQQRMNVAFTRPRRRTICFVSHSIENFPPGLVRDFLRHAANPRTTALDGNPWDSKFEQDVRAFLDAKGLRVTPQVRGWPKKPVDFVLRGPDGRIAALEADGRLPRARYSVAN